MTDLPPASSTTEPRKKCVLVLDDSLIALEFTCDALEAAGFSVLAASHPDELAQHFAGGTPIDLVILDVQMPDVLGDTLAKGLRSQRGGGVPILLCSGHDEAKLAERARDAAVDGYISKQAGLDAMIARVRHILHASDADAART
ncbi:MAG TPA: response regulator [Kofleriaceae bacterium]|nr:response regulator [Kofleriaceae bacterium]